MRCRYDRTWSCLSDQDVIVWKRRNSRSLPAPPMRMSRPALATQIIVPVVAGQDVIAVATLDLVVPQIAVEDVIAGPAAETVVAGATVQFRRNVDISTNGDLVVACQAVNPDQANPVDREHAEDLIVEPGPPGCHCSVH